MGGPQFPKKEEMRLFIYMRTKQKLMGNVCYQGE